MRFLRYPQKHQTDISGTAWNNKLVEQCVHGILEQNGGEKKKEKNSQTLLSCRGKGLSETRAIHPFRKTLRSILSHHPWKNFRDINSSRSIFISGMNVRNKAERQVWSKLDKFAWESKFYHNFARRKFFQFSS